MTLPQFRDLLLTVTPRVFHFVADCDDDQYIVWQEFGRKALFADNAPAARANKIQVDYYTKTEYDPMLAELLSALERDDICVAENPPLYEEETGYIRYILECEVM